MPNIIKKFTTNKMKNSKLEQHTVLVDIPKYFILISLTVLLILFFWMMVPFLPSLIIASVITTGFYPLYLKFLKIIKRPTLAAIIFSLLLLIVIITPITWFISYITSESINTYLLLESKVSELINSDFTLIPKILRDSFLGSYIDKYSQYVTINPNELIQYASKLVQNVSQFLIDKTAGLAKQISILALYVFVLLISTFFFFRDGDKIVHGIKDLIPLPRQYRDILVSKLHEISQGVLYGVFGSAIAQGFLGGVGFAVVGIQSAAFWGTVMAFFSIVPYIGSTVIWLPAVLYLFYSGHAIAGIFLLCWSMFLVGTVDNFLKPYLIGGTAHIHPLLSFIAIFGGIFAFGMVGLIIAPYILSLVLTFLHIYKLEYKKILGE
ncbi:MAG: hypothetical protein UR28_C0009G0022 [Candidatus Peregrinibacteria bacterium GW2011_GWF2_33_10]|nr:MAG: hypothetical protein UR28_C0009G0022 [Candidatus Peregrinibacteria bacterium GW2011_GWF2_33_10]OGJ44741.1 MAG: hypothetical protein A2263_02130 [Candidatus Peregrinibacteria bacterium RIFOXYA2_FULL_33_21]OGJ47340.1 MAG: hypothetical protein A2272_00600 [Candidatus Peregrinibacteria bacterium RIFOXYA12_FULL_33_12]OGJ50607.1 MAG: hypothetical protein A2307_00115 [Candidatus Peregrinibacteria bacterium RIFOXYB2_FULL_33_20]